MSSLFQPVETSPSKHHGLSPESVHACLMEMFGEDLHAKRVLSLSHGVLGVLHAPCMGIQAIGAALASVRGLQPKHAIKQTDRMLSNDGLDVETLAPQWVGFVLEAPEFIPAVSGSLGFEAESAARRVTGQGEVATIEFTEEGSDVNQLGARSRWSELDVEGASLPAPTSATSPTLSRSATRPSASSAD